MAEELDLPWCFDDEHLAWQNPHVHIHVTHQGATWEAVLAPPFHDGFWNGPSLHRATLDGTLAEWFRPSGRPFDPGPDPPPKIRSRQTELISAGAAPP